jgi:hypothetical protein
MSPTGWEAQRPEVLDNHFLLPSSLVLYRSKPAVSVLTDTNSSKSWEYLKSVWKKIAIVNFCYFLSWKLVRIQFTKFPAFVKSEGSLSCLRKSATGPYPEPNKFSSHSRRSILIFSFFLRLANCLFRFTFRFLSLCFVPHPSCTWYNHLNHFKKNKFWSHPFLLLTACYIVRLKQHLIFVHVGGNLQCLLRHPTLLVFGVCNQWLARRMLLFKFIHAALY